jgi:antirestriction protein ArdC
MKANQILEQFAKEVIDSMKKNNGRWEKMFGDNIDAINSVTNNRYRGINQLMLSFTSKNKEYKNNIWATYKQWESLNAQVNKGEKGTGIVFYKPAKYVSKKTGKPVPSGTILDNKTATKTWSVLRSSTVFNVSQVDLTNSEYKIPVIKTGKQYSIDAIDSFIKSTEVEIKNEDNNRCFYVPSKDYINMTSKEFFKDTKDSDATVNYYSVLFHELTHATGHKNRLDRKDKFDNDHTKSYAFEELIAETGAILFGKHFKIEKTIRPNHAQYLNSWIKALQKDFSFLTSAIAQASRAFEYYVK